MAEQTTVTLNSAAWRYRSSSSSYSGALRIGHQTSSGTSAGTYKSNLRFDITSDYANFPKIVSWSLSVRTSTDSNGWNGCVASVSHVSANTWSPTVYHTFTPTWNITETNGWHTWTTTDSTDMSYLKTLFTNGAASIYIQLVRVSGCGSKIVTSGYTPYMTTIYEKGNQFYVYNSGWKEAVPYVYINGVWTKAEGAIYNGGWVS